MHSDGTTPSNLSPEIRAVLDERIARQAAEYKALDEAAAKTSKESPPPEAGAAPRGKRRARTAPAEEHGNRPALDLIGAYDPVDQSTVIAADDVVAFVAPTYVTRTPIRYDELCRLLYRLAGSGEPVDVLARALGLEEDDVGRAIALWKRHLDRRSANTKRPGTGRRTKGHSRSSL